MRSTTNWRASCQGTGVSSPSLRRSGIVSRSSSLTHAVGEASLVADPLVVDLRILAADDAAQAVRARVQAHVAADGAMVADAGRALDFPGTVGEAGDPVGQRADGADVDDVAAGLGVDGFARLDVDERLAAAFVEGELRLVFPLLQVADTAPADDAAFLVQHDGVGDIVVFLLAALGLDQFADARAEAHGLVLQRAFAALVADGTIERVVEQQEGEIGFLRCLHLFGVRIDDHALGDRNGARGHELRATRPDDLDETHAAARHRVELGVAAEDRDVDVELGRRVHDEGACGDGHFPVVDG